MTTRFAIVDLFAGLGGLAEGFSSIRTSDNSRPFSVVLSVEKEASAYATLLLRAFLRQFDNGLPEKYYQFLNGEIPEPDWCDAYPRQWQAASLHALNLELGSAEAALEIDAKIDDIHQCHQGNTILIGGPPCQAYSVAGRVRNQGIAGYNPANDEKHFLYREYIRILNRLHPAVFVMENVKGMLSSLVDGEKIFDKVLSDLGAACGGDYQLVTLAPRVHTGADLNGRCPAPAEFIVCAENYGLPQARHRVIVVGIRKDFAECLSAAEVKKGLLGPSTARATLRDVLHGMPKLRSGISGLPDSAETWRNEVVRAIETVAKLDISLPEQQAEDFRALAHSLRSRITGAKSALPRSGAGSVSIRSKCPDELRDWLLDPMLQTVSNHETRSHMPSDLVRYLFAAVFSEVTGTSPKAKDYPDQIAPSHHNWKTGNFSDRFRVQLWDRPSTTITSHLAKDGHYFIHPDPAQCRSLTVREAARLQTFPDNYFFKGTRTQQYVQVGNAVPPFLAKQIAHALHSILSRKANIEVSTSAKANYQKKFKGRLELLRMVVNK